MVTLSHGGYQGQPLADYRAQKRGGRGKQAAAIRTRTSSISCSSPIPATTSCASSNRGRCYWLKVLRRRRAAATAAANRSSISSRWRASNINAVLPVKEFSDDQFVFMATLPWARSEDAAVRLLQSAQGRHHRRRARRRRLPDRCRVDLGQSDIVLVSDAGKAVWFDEEDVRPMGRGARGVRGMRCSQGSR